MALNTITQIVLPDGTEIGLADWTDRPLYSTADLGSGYTDQEVDLFQYTAGQAVPGAAPSPGFQLRSSTQNDTCIATAGEMATTEELLVYAVKPEIFVGLWDTENFGTFRYEGDPSDLGTILAGMPAAPLQVMAILQQALLLRLRVSEKDYVQSGLAYHNPGFGVFGVGTMVPATAAGGNDARTLAVNGLPSQQAVRSFALPVHIAAQEKYRLTLVNDPGTPVNFGLAYAEDTLVNDPEVMVRMRVYLDGLYKRPTA